MAPQQELHVVVDFVTPAAWAFPQQVRLQLQYVISDIGDSATPGAVTGTLTQDLTFPNFPNAGATFRQTFTIPRADLVPGGKASLSIFRRGDQPLSDTCPFSLDIINIATHFGSPLT